MASTAKGTEHLRLALADLANGWVLLHGNPQALSGGGDVDLAVTGRAVPFLEQLADRLAPVLTPVVSLEHDQGEWTTVFATPGLDDFVQVDVASGDLGRYGVNCPRLHDRAIAREGLWVLPEIDQLLYRLVKRVSKGQIDRARVIRQELQTAWPPEEVEAAVVNGFAPWARNWLAAELKKSISDGFSAVPRRGHLARLRRRARRVMLPPGAIVEVPASEVARIAARLEAVTIRQIHVRPRQSNRPSRVLRARGDLVVVPVAEPSEPLTAALARYVASVWERHR